MQTSQLPFKQDDFNNNIYARLSWSSGSPDVSKPIVLIFHGGGLIVGSADVVPKSQIEWLATHGFLVVIPNYRLVPQIMGKDSLSDCEEACDWAVRQLPDLMRSQHSINVDFDRFVTMGHSSGGTIALHIASTKQAKAVIAFYPSLYIGDPSTSSHKPSNVPPFGNVPTFAPTEDDWAAIKPVGKQLSEAPLGAPGVPPSPRTRWQLSLLKNGEWIKALCPDGDYTALDPISVPEAHFPPTMIVQGEIDKAPGSDLSLAQRALKDLIARGTKDVHLKVVPDAGHMFDLPLMVGTSDLGPKWQAVLDGLQFLKDHV